MAMTKPILPAVCFSSSIMNMDGVNSPETLVINYRLRSVTYPARQSSSLHAYSCQFMRQMAILHQASRLKAYIMNFNCSFQLCRVSELASRRERRAYILCSSPRILVRIFAFTKPTCWSWSDHVGRK